MAAIIQTGLRCLSSQGIQFQKHFLTKVSLNLSKDFIFKVFYRNYCAPATEDLVTVNFILKNGERKTVKGKCGQHVMEVAQENDIDIEGACAASLACSTCHVYVAPEYYNKLEPPEDLEEDMLDQAPFLKENSRLSCQIILSKDIEGIEVSLPHATRNFYVDGHKPSHH